MDEFSAVHFIHRFLFVERKGVGIERHGLSPHQGEISGGTWASGNFLPEGV
jgi:hypothetical protein